MIIFKKTYIFFCFALFPLLLACGQGKENGEEAESKSAEEAGQEKIEVPVSYGVRSIRVRNLGPLGRVFNDSNYLQLEAARRLGIDPISDLSSAYFTRRPLVKVESNQYYQIDSLRHSVPYLVPEAANLLEEIGRNFNDSLHGRGGDSYRIKVTSLLRTPESVSRLRRVNINATDSSTHQYATTFDISYVNFHCLDERRQINQGDLKNLLGEVLYDLREQGRCLVKYEYKTGCYHVTVTK